MKRILIVKRISIFSFSVIVISFFYTSTMLSAPAAVSTSDGVYTADQAGRGDALYRQQCASCHGADLGGKEPTPPLAGDDFMTNWVGQTLDALFDRIQVSMPADHPNSLTRPQTADVLAYILNANKFAPGKSDLPVDADALKQIHIDKPPVPAPSAPPAKN
jgi:S-disulfanyl-L-cysteine oxidoreductase SoxD